MLLNPTLHLTVELLVARLWLLREVAEVPERHLASPPIPVPVHYVDRIWQDFDALHHIFPVKVDGLLESHLPVLVLDGDIGDFLELIGFFHFELVEGWSDFVVAGNGEVFFLQIFFGKLEFLGDDFVVLFYVEDLLDFSPFVVFRVSFLPVIHLSCVSFLLVLIHYLQVFLLSKVIWTFELVLVFRAQFEGSVRY